MGSRGREVGVGGMYEVVTEANLPLPPSHCRRPLVPAYPKKAMALGEMVLSFPYDAARL